MYEIMVLTRRGLTPIEVSTDRNYCEYAVEEVAKYWHNDCDYISSFIENLDTGEIMKEVF